MTFTSKETSRDEGEPYQLFWFRSGTQDYRYTTLSSSVWVDTVEYSPDQAMGSAEIKETMSGDKGKLNFQVMRNHEVAQLFLISSPRTVSLVVYSGHTSDPDDELIPSWTGRVIACDWNDEDQATLSCESISTILQRNGLPYTFGSTCQHTLYRGGCKLDIFANSALYEITSLSGYTITVPDLIDSPSNEYDAGLVIAKDVDYRMVTGFDNLTGVLTLLRPFEGVEAGEIVRIAVGCNRSSARCEELGNFENYLGFDTVPRRNPFEGLKQTGVTILAEP